MCILLTVYVAYNNILSILLYRLNLMQRTLTISTKHHSREHRYIVVPAIRIEGKWLNELGFKRGEKVKLLCKKNKLVIIKDN